MEVNRLLGEITVQSPAAEHNNSAIVKNVLTIERKHLVRAELELIAGVLWGFFLDRPMPLGGGKGFKA